ncbi:MAG: efflux RND transporter periplasmic adaptor subunit, partial [Desulfobulbaceae bacterium]|nr:efflux RND transporter periplasmic adaptor subunit [Desulfobulbaceae bacterium]
MRPHDSMHNAVKKIVAITTLLSGLLATGCDRPPQNPPQLPAPAVSTVTVQPEKIMLSTELPGRTTAFRVAEIRPQVNGLIKKRLFEEGSDVEAGQILFEIDPAPFQAALDNALAALARSEATLPTAKARAERLGKLVEDKAVSRQQYDDAQATLAQVEADIMLWKATVETARINLAYTKVTAPIPGRIGKSVVTEGAIVTAYQPVPLAVIQQLDPIYVDVPQSTTELLRLRQRMAKGLLSRDNEDQNKVDLILEDGSSYPLAGTLQFSDVTVDPTTGSVTLRALFPNPENDLLPGMFVRATIREGSNEQAILVPQQGVSRDPKGNGYALVVDGKSKAAFRPLTLERAIGDKWLVA